MCWQMPKPFIERSFYILQQLFRSTAGLWNEGGRFINTVLEKDQRMKKQPTVDAYECFLNESEDPPNPDKTIECRYLGWHAFRLFECLRRVAGLPILVINLKGQVKVVTIKLSTRSNAEVK